MENIGMAGNEKSTVMFALQDAEAIKAGYHLAWGDTFLFGTQLMNLQDKEKWVWVTVTYDYVDGRRPDYLMSRFIWKSLSSQTAGACTGDNKNPFGASNLTENMQPKTLKFSEHSIPISAATDGVILTTGGHMHDGGVGVDTLLNDKVICTSVASYKAGAQGMGGHGHKKRQIAGGNHDNMGIEHISGQTRCYWPKGFPIARTDKLYIRANYDFNIHPG